MLQYSTYSLAKLYGILLWLVVNEDQDTAIGTEDKDNSQALPTDGKERHLV